MSGASFSTGLSYRPRPWLVLPDVTKGDAVH